jgi:2'-5' RNA ligase
VGVESAIVIPVGYAEPLVGPLRMLHDTFAARGVPAHITLLAPFIPPPSVLDVTDDLTRFFADVEPFDFMLTSVRRFPRMAYLHPHPPDPFVDLTTRLAQRYPAYQPFGGAFETVIPHLTIAYQADDAVLDSVERALAPKLPLACRATSASLLCSDESGWWMPICEFPFGG